MTQRYILQKIYCLTLPRCLTLPQARLQSERALAKLVRFSLQWWFQSHLKNVWSTNIINVKQVVLVINHAQLALTPEKNRYRINSTTEQIQNESLRDWIFNFQPSFYCFPRKLIVSNISNTSSLFINICSIWSLSISDNWKRNNKRAII